MAVDRQHTRMIANDVTNDPGDCAWRSPMALQAKEVLGCPCEAVADVGSYHGEEVKICLEAGLTSSVARPSTSANQQRGLFSKDDCTDAGATDTSQGPAGARRTFRLATVERGRPIRS
jgi:hypothetical protein